MALPLGMSDLQSLTLYRALFDASPDALLLVDRSGRVCLSNPAASRLLGYSVEELLGLPVEALVPDAIRPRHAEYRAQYGLSPRARAMGAHSDLVARRRDGSVVKVEIALSPLQHGGEPLVVAAVRGVEEYPRIQQALRRARYSECVAQVGRVAVDSRDPQRLLQHVPPVAAEALQADAVLIYLLDAARRSFRVAAAAPDDAAEGLDSVFAGDARSPAGYVLAQGGPVAVADYRSEQRFTVPPSYLAQGYVSALAVPVSDRGQIIGVLCAKTRQQRRFEDDELHFMVSLANLLATSLQRAHSEEALSHSQRLESVGQLTGGIAHDFNNLLTIIQGNLQVLDEHPAVQGDGRAQQLLASAGRASRRAAELTSKLLAFSRRQVLSPKAVDVGAMLEALADMLRRTLEQNIRIEVEADEAVSCLADPGQLESALLNLAINARDAMPEGGVLAFACRRLTTLPADVAAELGLGAGATAAHVSIEVADTGRGMSEAVRERAFEPFFTTKEYGRGTGLGLSTVYGFVKQSQGAVRLQTAVGAGTRIALLLPQASPASAAAASSMPAHGHAAEGPGGGDTAGEPATARLPPNLKVLLVEDEPEVRSTVRGFLHALGCVVDEFATAEEALARIADAADNDLLLSDIALGTGLRGTELARRIRERLPGIAVLLMSGYSSDLLRGRDTDAALPNLLRKPFDREQLARAMARSLAEQPQ